MSRFKGKTHTPETRAKMAAAKRGKTHTPETRAKMAANRGAESRDLTLEQFALYQLFRRRGCDKTEARRLALGE